MASLSHSLYDYPTIRNCKEASSVSMYPSTCNNNMQDLYALLQTLHPQFLQQPSPYSIPAPKPFYYSSNLQGMSKVSAEEDLGSLSTSWCPPDHPAAAPLHHHTSMQESAMENKALNTSSSNHLHVAAELHVNAAKKRIRAIMDHKDDDAKYTGSNNGMKRMKSSGSSSGNGEIRVQKMDLIPVEVKLTNNNAQKAGGITPNKLDYTEPKSSSDVKSNGKASASSTIEPSSPSKPDFIHVRARRGQATDSHSLAERVRREKISERMKYLQDLVPGCIKVTGKAMMLDEIINYVQALQRQVEFLSMKLAAVHPSKLEFSLESLFGKKVVQPKSVKGESPLGNGAPSTDCQGNADGIYSIRGNETFCDSMRLHEVDASLLRTANQMPCNPAEFLANLQSDLGVGNDAFMHGVAAANSGCPSTTDAMLEPTYQSCISQTSHSELDWDDDLQNIVQQMGCFQQASPMCPPHLLSEGLFLQSNMKAEL